MGFEREQKKRDRPIKLVRWEHYAVNINTRRRLPLAVMRMQLELLELLLLFPLNRWSF